MPVTTHSSIRAGLKCLTDEELAERARDDPVALNVLLDRIRPGLLAFAKSRGVQEDADAEDLAQKTLMRIAKHIGNYDPKHGARLRTWAYTILYRLMLNENRSTRRRLRAEEALHCQLHVEHEANLIGAWMRPDEELLEKQLSEQVEDGLATLPEVFQQVLRLSMEGLSDAEIAARCGLKSEGTVKSRKHRARERIRVALANVA